ncbi:hypothetical protein [Nodosilinea sp. P-1105]|uniref:hypothetical protein n=1 Tax=Nodosilinea sp. P-1105 TaxID=2546229 RepID=UPI00146F7E6E|nr:hypothetical protein [Nodosilinea sp. P-1105]NMF83562.1 hypothetical protein [Nodosilinea sp. P-1105]
MTRLNFGPRRWLVPLALVVTGCLNGPSSTSEPRQPLTANAASPPMDGATLWYQAAGEANRAAQLAQEASTAAEWNQVAQAWSQSVGLLKAIPADDPRQVFSQRKAQDYLSNLQVAQQQARQAGVSRVFPPLGTDVFDEQVSLYHSYVATLGPPDILILGSSRALQGIDPVVLQQALAVQGYPGLRVYNFSVNGATAQVVSFITRQLLAPDMYPRLVIWAEGSRGLNSGRFDRTFAEVLASPGYAAVQTGARLTVQDTDQADTEASQPQAETDQGPETDADPAAKADGTVPASPINSQGFLAVNDQFNPAVYYQTFPRVRGQYDNAYRPFRLEGGVQAMSFEAVIDFLRAENIPLVFVNLPLSNDYLDPVRIGYERQFQQFLQARAEAMTLVDLLDVWRWQSHLFADPSHINRYGAREIARLLAEDERIPWPEADQPPQADTDTDLENSPGPEAL